MERDDHNKADLHLLNLIGELCETLNAKIDASEFGVQGRIKIFWGVVFADWLRNKILESSSLRTELEYWKRKSDRGDGQYWQILEPLSNALNLIRGQRLEELTGLLETAEDCVDNLWKCVEPFPQPRMKKIIYLIGKFNNLYLL